MLRTAFACALLAFCGYAAAAWLTHDFQAWTSEGARRLEVALAPVPVPPVTVAGAHAAPQALPQVLGDAVAIADFVYTRCETVCLALGSGFQQMQAVLAAQVPGTPRVQLLSVSFDPRDTTHDLAAYAGRLQADPALWRFVRVQDDAGLQRLLRDFQVTVVPAAHGDFEHNAALLVIHRGRLVRIFDLAEQELALNYARHLAGEPPR